MRSYSVIKAANMLGVCRRTIKTWIYTHKLNTFLTPNGYHRIPESEINKYLLNNSNNKVILYARVSSHQQKDDLERQKLKLKEYAINKNYEVIIELNDIASGLNDNRKNLFKALELIKLNKANKIIITHKDRLTRFGYKYLEYMINSYNSEIEVIDNSEIKEDYVKDLINVVTCFCAKVYGRRSKKQIRTIIESLK
jgi:putative resolvase